MSLVIGQHAVGVHLKDQAEEVGLADGQHA